MDFDQMAAEMAPDKIDCLHQNLAAWYSANHRKLPWRETRDPYRIWVSEVMLQQTQVKTVLPYYAEFLRRFPDVHRLAQADLQEVLKAWEGLGYYARARNLHRAAKLLLAEHGGKVPRQYEALRKLPGVGDYIAAAVGSIAFGLDRAVLDGNVKRVLARLFCIDLPVNTAGAHKVLQETVGRLLDADRPALFNQAMMELGALVCTPREPACGGCPLQSCCGAYQQARVAEYPRRIKKRPTPGYHIAVGAVYRDDYFLITRRRNEGLLGGLWEFPGGKVKPGESAEQACRREIREEVDLTVEIDAYLTRVKHAYTHFKIVMDIFCCKYVKGEVKLKGAVDYRWITLDELEQYPFPKANHKFFPLLRARI